MENPESWCTIESDPGVFTEFINQIGVKNVQVEELYSINDDYQISQLQPIYGFIFLFKWNQKIQEKDSLEYYDDKLFFANQIIPNACATQAILSILLNQSGNINLGPTLTNFKDFSAGLCSKMKGLAIGNSQAIRDAHNSFKKAEPFEFTEGKRAAKEDDEVYHFVSYIPFNGKVYELDGLQKGPIQLGSYQNQNDWISIVQKELNQQIQKYAENEIRFNLMAVIQSKQSIAEKNIQKGLKQKRQIYDYCISKNIQLSEQQKQDYETMKIEKTEGIEEEFDFGTISENTFKQKVDEINFEIAEQFKIVEEEKSKREKYRQENIRRKHNYIPFILELFKLTASKGKLEQLITNAKKIQEEKQQKKQEEKAKKQEEQKKEEQK